MKALSRLFAAAATAAALSAPGCRRVAYEHGEIVAPPPGYLEMVVREPDSIFAPNSAQDRNGGPEAE